MIRNRHLLAALVLVPLALWAAAVLPGSVAGNGGFWQWRRAVVLLSGVIVLWWMSAGILLATRPAWLERTLGGLDQIFGARQYVFGAPQNVFADGGHDDLTARPVDQAHAESLFKLGNPRRQGGLRDEGGFGGGDEAFVLVEKLEVMELAQGR